MDLIDREQLKATIRKMVEIPNETRAQVIGSISRAKAIEPKTNADRIRAWNDHELAESISNFVSDIDNGNVRYSDDPNDWLEWLQQPAEE